MPGSVLGGAPSGATLLRDHRLDASFHMDPSGAVVASPASKLWRRSCDRGRGGALADHTQATVRHDLTILYRLCTTPAVQPPTDRVRRPPTPARTMANRDKAPNRAARADRQRPGVVGAVAGEHPRTQRLLRGAGLHRTAGARAGPHGAARSDHPRRPDARHARLRGLPHAARRSPVQRHHADRDHHLGPLRPHPAARGVPRRRLGVPRPAARRRGAPAQAEHLSPVQARSGCAARGEPARSRHRALQHAGSLPPGAGDRRRGLPPPRSRRLRRVLARRWTRAKRRSPEDEEPAACPIRSACSSARRAAPPMPSAAWGQSEFAVIAPATGPEAAVRLVRRLGGAVESSPIPVRGGERTLRLRAGYCAVADFAESSVDAVELLLRATTALRDLKREGDGESGSAPSSRSPRGSPTSHNWLSVGAGTTISARVSARPCGSAPAHVLDTRRTLLYKRHSERCIYAAAPAGPSR